MQEVERFDQLGGGEGVIDPLGVAAAGDEPSAAEDRRVLGDVRLGQLELVADVADRHLPMAERVDDRESLGARSERPSCASCGDEVAVKDRPVVELTDLPCFGTPAVLVWRKTRWVVCGGCSFTEHAPGIAASRLRMTDRAARWATVQGGTSWPVGGRGRHRP